MMSKYTGAKEVLVRSREEILRELIRAGENGGSGLAQRYAPILVHLQQAIDVVDRIDDQPKITTKAVSKENFAEKMAAAKAAKKAALAA